MFRKAIALLLLINIATAEVRSTISGTFANTGASNKTINVINTGADYFTLLYSTNGSPATISIKIQGSNNGFWTDCGLAGTSATSGKVECSGHYEKVRVNLVTMTGGTNPSVKYALSAGFKLIGGGEIVPNPAPVPTPGLTAGCGAANLGLNTRDQSTCGKNGSDAYVAEGTTQAAYDAAATQLFACNTALATNTNYVLMNDVTAGGGDANDCFNIGLNTRLSLGNHTVNGRINKNGNYNGASIFNGNIICTWADSASNAGCVRLISTSPYTATVKVHHLNVQNNQTGASNVRAIHFEWTPLSGSWAQGIQVFNITNAVQSNSSSRAYGISVIGNSLMGFKAYNNDLSCVATASACGTIADTNAQGNEVYDNRIILSSSGVAETARGITTDANVLPSGDLGSDIHNNLITANGNRATRTRERLAWVRDNGILDCNYNAMHMYDQTNVQQSNYDAGIGLKYFNNNFINPQASCVGFYGRGGAGARIYDNTLTGAAAGKLAFFESFSAGTTFDTTATLCNNASLSVAANIKATNAGTSTTTLTKFNSGSTDATSTGTVNSVAGCPF
jgi:hypothetical protein